jgi:hypothetical protein
MAFQSSTLPKGYDVMKTDDLHFSSSGQTRCAMARFCTPLLASRATWVYRAVMAVVARPDNLTQALDTLNRQFGMGVFEMGWISKATMQELDCIQAVLQLLHEPFIFVHAGPWLSFNRYPNCNTVQHAESREPIQKLRARAPLHQLSLQLSTSSMRGASEGQQCDCVVGWIEQPVQGRAAVTHPIGHLHLCDVAFKHSLFDLPCNLFLDRCPEPSPSSPRTVKASWTEMS